MVSLTRGTGLGSRSSRTSSSSGAASSIAAISIVVGMLIAFVFITPIFAFVFQPLRGVLPAGSKLIYTQPGEAFSVYVQIALIAGIVFATPFIMYQVWRLIAPGLYLHQKRLALPFILLTTGGFVGGALFNHFIVFRWMMAFFGSFDSFNLSFMPRLDDVFGLYTKMLFGMGLVFQMPAVVYFLARMGLVTARFLWRSTKYAVLIIFIAAAVITPGGDVATQALFAHADDRPLHLQYPHRLDRGPGDAARRCHRRPTGVRAKHGYTNVCDPPSRPRLTGIGFLLVLIAIVALSLEWFRHRRPRRCSAAASRR